MAATQSAIDWATVEMTTAAANTKSPDKRACVIRVARKDIQRTWHGGEWSQWSGLEAAAARGEADPLVIMPTVDWAPHDTAYMRAGESREKSLTGRTLLLNQGWKAA